MPLINKIIIYFFSIFIFSTTFISAEELKKIGKYKDWETLVLIKDNELTCFAQTKPVLQSPKANIREARESKFQELEVEFQRALETGAPTTDIVAKKQALRDAPADSDITAASDADALKAQWKTDILGTSPYS